MIAVKYALEKRRRRRRLRRPWKVLLPRQRVIIRTSSPLGSSGPP
jgi:hypothetical protein